MKRRWISSAVCGTISLLTVASLTVGMAYADGEVARGAARGALGGAAIGKLSDGDTGKGAAWGAGAGAMRGMAEKKRNQEEAYTRNLELDNAYNQGYQAGFRDGMNARSSGGVQKTTQ